MDYVKRCFPKCGTIGIRVRILEKVRNVQLKEWQKYVLPAVVIAIVWGLVVLPIIFYHLPNNRVRLANYIDYWLIPIVLVKAFVTITFVMKISRIFKISST